VGADRIVREPGKTNFAGSAATPREVVFRAAEMLGVSWEETWPRMSTGPARWLGLTP
jgi:N-acetylglucosamine-6-phosphate deacetylase